jgi:DNA polymerase-3 subunit beta
MKIDTDRLHVKDAAALVARAVTTRGSLPALSGVLVTADPSSGTVTLAGTDLATAVRASFVADVIEPGRVLVPAKTLRELVRNGADRLTLSTDDDGARLHVTGDGTTVELRTMPVEDFPTLPGPDGPGVTFGPAVVDVLQRVAGAAATDESRPVLTGVNFNGTDAAATDSYRLTIGDIGPTGPLSGALVPAPAVADVCRWKHDGHALRVTVDQTGPDGHVGAVTFAGYHVTGSKRAPRETAVELWTRTIEGTYPDYGKLWPDDVAGDGWTSVELEPAAVGDALDALRAFQTGRNVPARTTVDYDGRAFVLTMLSAELGEGSARVPLERLPADVWPDAAYNPASLRAAVDAARTDVTLWVRDGLKPAVVAGNDRVRTLLMPMRIS